MFVCADCAIPALYWQLSRCGMDTELWLSVQSIGGVLLPLLRCWGWNRINRRAAEVTPPLDIFFRREPLWTVCDGGSKGRGEGNLSYPVSVHTDPQRLMFIHPPMTKKEQRRDRGDRRNRDGAGKQRVFIFLYVCKVRICGTRMKEWRFPPAFCLELDPVRAAAIGLSEPRTGQLFWWLQHLKKA